MTLGPVQKVQGIICQGAHVLGRHVQQMVGTRGGICYTAPQRRAGLDQNHRQRVLRSTKQLCGQNTAKRKDYNQSGFLRSFLRARFRARACFTRRFAPGFR
jgi:hypothetical protein